MMVFFHGFLLKAYKESFLKGGAGFPANLCPGMNPATCGHHHVPRSQLVSDSTFFPSGCVNTSPSRLGAVAPRTSRRVSVIPFCTKNKFSGCLDQ